MNTFTTTQAIEEGNRSINRGARPVKKSSGVLCQGTTVKYAWIKQHEAEFSVNVMCRFMSVSRSAYYAWRVHPLTAIEKDDIELIEIIKSLFQKGRKNYGTRRLKKALVGLDRQVSRRRIGRLMGDTGLACKTKRKFIATTHSKTLTELRNRPPAEMELLRRAYVLVMES